MGGKIYLAFMHEDAGSVFLRNVSTQQNITLRNNAVYHRLYLIQRGQGDTTSWLL